MNSLQQKITEYLKIRKMTMSFFGKSQYRDWKILIYGTFIAMLISASWGVWLLYDFNEGELFNIDSTSFAPQKKINKEMLSKMIQRVEDKKKNFEDLKTNKPLVSDPSL